MVKKSNGWAKWIAISGAVVVLALTFLVWVWNASGAYSRINTLCKENTRDHPKIQENRESIIRMESKLDSIKQGVDDIKKELKE